MQLAHKRVGTWMTHCRPVVGMRHMGVWTSMTQPGSALFHALSVGLACAYLVDNSVQREKVELAAERQRLHQEIVSGLNDLTKHITFVQTRLNDGVQVLNEKKASLVGSA